MARLDPGEEVELSRASSGRTNGGSSRLYKGQAAQQLGDLDRRLVASVASLGGWRFGSHNCRCRSVYFVGAS